MKKIFKKAVTVLGSFALLGATIGMAAAASYPAPFTSNTAVVVGANAASSDNIAAGNIASNLDATYAGSGSTDTGTTEGEIVSVGSSSTPIYLNLSLNTANSVFTKTNLPTVLGDFTFSGNVDAKLTSQIKFGAGTAAGADNSGKIIFAKQPKSSNDPVIGISLGTDEGNYFVNASFTSPAIAFNHTDSEGENVRLFGRDFVVSTATTGTDLILFASSEEISLIAGGDNSNPLETVTVNGATYEVELISATDTSATISVNGDVKEINEGASKKVGGIDIAVKIADENTALNQVSATVLVGADKITFTHGSKVKIGSDDTLIDGTHVYMNGTDPTPGNVVGSLTELRVAYFREGSSEDALLSGDEWIDPVFGAFKVDFAGLSSNLDDETRDVISIESSGDDDMSISFTDSNGETGDFVFAHNQSSSFHLADDNNKTIHIVENQNISEEEFVILGNEEYGHLLEVIQISNDTGTDATKDKVVVRDVFSDTNYESTFTTEGSGKLNLDGKEYAVTFRGDGDTGRAQFKYPTGDSANAGTLVVFPTIETASGANVALVQTISVNLGSADGNLDSAGLNDVTTINFPDGDGYAGVTIAWGSDPLVSNWTLSGQTHTGGGQLNNTAGFTTNVTIGDIIYSFEMISPTSNDTLISVNRVAISSGAQNIPRNDNRTNPGVMIWEEQDDSSGKEYKVIYIDLEEGGTSTDGVGVNDAFFTSDTRWSATLASNSDIENEVDWWGTLVTTDSGDSDQKIVTISYPDEQVYANIFLGEASASVGGSAGVMTYTDAEATSFAGMNLVVVGGSCINAVAAELLGGAYCEGAFTTNTGVSAGSFLIESFDRSGKTATLVAGYNAEDTTKASTYLLNNDVVTDVGTKYTGSSATEATLVVA